jgi:hypothetical protein
MGSELSALRQENQRLRAALEASDCAFYRKFYMTVQQSLNHAQFEGRQTFWPPPDLNSGG